MNIAKILRTVFLYRTPPLAASKTAEIVPQIHILSGSPLNAYQKLNYSFIREGGVCSHYVSATITVIQYSSDGIAQNEPQQIKQFQSQKKSASEQYV